MSLLTSLNVGLNAIQTQQSALQTDGHNIANANTPGYSRQRVDLVTQLPQDLIYTQIGKGVRLARVERLVDATINARLQDASSALGNLQVRHDFLSRVESVMNDLSDSNLSTAFDRFFTSLEQLSTRPEDTAARREVVSQGETLAQMFQDLGGQIRDFRKDVDTEVAALTGQMNTFVTQIAELNDQIVNQENGGIDAGTANDLRDRRDLLLQQLSEIVDIRVIENPQGMSQVLEGSSYLVFDKTAYSVDVKESTNREIQVSTPQFTTSGINLELRSGKLRGLVDVRDEILGGLSDRLNELARSVIFEMNKLQAVGQGLVRNTDLTSVEGLSDPSLSSVPLATDGTITGLPTSTSLTDSSLTSYADDYFVGMDVLVTSGDAAGQRRRVVDFFASTGTLIFDKPFDTPLDAGDTFQITGLPFAIKNGSFDLQVTNELTGEVRTFNISVDLDKLPVPPPSDPRDTTLQSLVDEITAEVTTAAGGFSQITASITGTNHLRIRSSDPNVTFSFANDTSDLLASLGMNTFFTGSGAADMAVNSLVSKRPELIAAARSNVAGDNTNALAMAQLRGKTVLDGGKTTIEGFYQQIVGRVGTQVQEAKDRLTNQETLNQQLSNARERVSGVNLDEEAVNMITHQRAFQAAARYISVIDQLLDTLINRT